MDDAWRGAIFGAIVGFPGGLYSSVFLHRWNKYRDLKNEARRLIHAFEFIGSGSDFRIEEKKDLGELVYVAADLRQWGHATTADEILALFSEIRETAHQVKTKNLEFSILMTRYDQWLWRLGRTKPSLPRIFHPNPFR